jgi:hypothetical protein
MTWLGYRLEDGHEQCSNKTPCWPGTVRGSCLTHLRNRSTSAISIYDYVFPTALQSLVGQGLLTVEASQSHSHTHTLGRTPVHEWSGRRKAFYLKTNNTHTRQTSMTLAGFEPAIPASERSQVHVLDSADTGIGYVRLYRCKSTHRTFSPSTADSSWNTLYSNQRHLKHWSLQFA